MRDVAKSHIDGSTSLTWKGGIMDKLDGEVGVISYLNE